MRLHDLYPADGSNKRSKRLGRGVGSGKGKTSGKGHKGAKARSGGGKGPGFEGGQMPLIRRLPKRGFTNIFSTEYVAVNLGSLEVFEDGTVVTPEMLKANGIVKKFNDGIKILADGEFSKNLTIQATKFSKSAEEKIVANGGKAEVI